MSANTIAPASLTWKRTRAGRYSAANGNAERYVAVRIGTTWDLTMVRLTEFHGVWITDTNREVALVGMEMTSYREAKELAAFHAATPEPATFSAPSRTSQAWDAWNRASGI